MAQEHSAVPARSSAAFVGAVVVGALLPGSVLVTARLVAVLVPRTSFDEVAFWGGWFLAPLLPPGGRITHVTADRSGTADGFPSWAWFDEATDGGYTSVEVQMPMSPTSSALAVQALVEAMRENDWRAGLAAPRLSTEVEGIRDGVYLRDPRRQGAGLTTAVDAAQAVRWRRASSA